MSVRSHSSFNSPQDSPRCWGNSWKEGMDTLSPNLMHRIKPQARSQKYMTTAPKKQSQVIFSFFKTFLQNISFFKIYFYFEVCVRECICYICMSSDIHGCSERVWDALELELYVSCELLNKNAEDQTWVFWKNS